MALQAGVDEANARVAAALAAEGEARGALAAAIAEKTIIERKMGVLTQVGRTPRLRSIRPRAL